MEVVFPGDRLQWKSSSTFQNFENRFEIFWGRPANVTKQAGLIFCYFTTSPGGWPPDGRVATGW